MLQENRYDNMQYMLCGKHGLKLPRLSLGFWNSFGCMDSRDNMVDILTTALNCGITYFDLANTYGRPRFGSAEENLGDILSKELSGHRDEIVIATKAGYGFKAGPYGSGGSRKHLLQSIDGSLLRLGTEYVDIFYSHRFDPEVPLEETACALADIVKRGKALYIGISNYDAEQTRRMYTLLRAQGVPVIVHQLRYNLFTRTAEEGLFDAITECGMGAVAFSPLSQGILSDKYINGVGEGSRASVSYSTLKAADITPEKIETVKKLNLIASERGENLAQMAIAWVMQHPAVTSVLMGASRPEQILENCSVLEAGKFTKEQLLNIENALNSKKV